MTNPKDAACVHTVWVTVHSDGYSIHRHKDTAENYGAVRGKLLALKRITITEGEFNK